MANSKTTQLTEGVIWKQLLIFSLPIALGTIVQQLYNVADAAIVGRFVGKAALASVGGSASVIVNMVVYFFSGLASGAAVIVAQFCGAKDSVKIQKSLHTAYAFSLILSVFLSVIGWFVTPMLLKMMNTPADVLADSITYMRIYFVGLIATLAYNMGSAIMRAAGDSRRPLYYLILSSVLNIVLDLVMILVFDMGIAGAAIATVISQAVSAILVAYSLMHSYDEMKLSLRELRIDKNILIAELKVGLPGGLQFCISGITNIILQSAINGFGTDTAAAWAAYNKIDMIFWTLLGAFGATITTFVGQNFGAKKYSRMLKGIRVCLLLALVFCGIAQFCLYAFCRPMFLAFTADANVIDIGVYMMRYMVPIYIVFVFSEIPAGALRGMGNAAAPTAFNFIATICLKIPWILLVLPKYPVLETVMLSYPLSGVCSGALTVIYYFYKKRKLMKTQY